MREKRGRDISMIFQEPMTSLNPVLSIGQQVMEPLLIHMKMSDEQAHGPRAGIDAACRHHRRRAPARAISASSLRRHAPARDDRDRACMQSQAHHRGRADHRARRHHPGADPRTDEGAVAPTRHRAGRHHAQSRHRGALRRPRERDVCGAHHRAGLGRQRVPRAGAPLRDRPDALDPAARSAARRQARDHRGPAARSAHAAGGLPFCAALPLPASTPARSRTCGSPRCGRGIARPASARARSSPARWCRRARAGHAARPRGDECRAAADRRSPEEISSP